jgi:hypothetical protein
MELAAGAGYCRMLELVAAATPKRPRYLFVLNHGASALVLALMDSVQFSLMI